MRNEKLLRDKSAEAVVKRAEDCFDLAKTQHDAADLQHSIASRQLNNADKQHDIASQQLDKADKQHANADTQQEIAATQHESADGLEASAGKLKALGNALIDEAVAIKAETQLVERGNGGVLATDKIRTNSSRFPVFPSSRPT